MAATRATARTGASGSTSASTPAHSSRLSSLVTMDCIVLYVISRTISEIYIDQHFKFSSVTRTSTGPYRSCAALLAVIMNDLTIRALPNVVIPTL